MRVAPDLSRPFDNNFITVGAAPEIRSPNAGTQNAPHNKTSCWPINLIGAVKRAVEFHCPCPKEPEFTFEMTLKVTEKDFCVMAKHGKSLEQALLAQRKSLLGYGFEFCPVSILEGLF